MKKLLITILLLLTIINSAILGYLLSTQESIRIQTEYTNEVLEEVKQELKDANQELDLLKKALLYSDKKSRKILKQWYKYWNKK